MERPSFPSLSVNKEIECGISPGFPRLSPTGGLITHVLLTCAPLY